MRIVLIGIAALILFGAGIALNLMLEGADHSDPMPSQNAAASSNPASPPVPSLPASTAPPPETFARTFLPCAHCHQIGEGAHASSGPVLNDIVGRPAATGDYPYSDALKRSGLVWDEKTLRAFLADPSKVVPGTRMIFEGLEADEIDQVIDFLKHPVPDTQS